MARPALCLPRTETLGTRLVTRLAGVSLVAVGAVGAARHALPGRREVGVAGGEIIARGSAGG